MQYIVVNYFYPRNKIKNRLINLIIKRYSFGRIDDVLFT